ncbi:DUF6880 family protein [Brevundimonas variabilis]|uniref:Uncharacterized protein n=1 Tax=Brevundimonas variabilis TaxID=74312 RepID=A0A7W9CJ57_9CAUL|nr:DUF6880 family protein [Brevundimonas variabilis]MBB5746373.1 hypothetical protein [Brevundimonas variabilis]
MAKRSTTARKSLSTTNLVALGAERLADLLLEATVGDAGLKRRLKLELAAEVGPADLALEIDKRLAALAASRTRVSWRKRPELIADLQVHRRAIVEKLAPKDPGLALGSLVAWFDLYPGLDQRVKDPKGELALVFFDAAENLADVASAVGPDDAGAILAEAVETRLSDWAGWVGRAAPSMSIPVAERLLALLTDGRARPIGRRALVVRKLADRAGNAIAWARTWSDEDQLKPDVGAEVARRLAAAGLAETARVALDQCRPRLGPPARKGAADTLPEPSPAWETAEIAVLEAEGRSPEAQDARWAAFSRTLDVAHLRDFVARLADFDDVEAIDRAHALAANWSEAARGLAFLMEWPALREAAAMILARANEFRSLNDSVPLWISRLESRYPAAALVLVRSRARALAPLGPSRAEEVRALSIEAAELAIQAGAVDDLESHAAFIDSLEAIASRTGRPRWG